MNSVKMKSNNYVKLGMKSISQVVLVATANKLFDVYVAWEWEHKAKDGYFFVFKSEKPIRYVSEFEVENVTSYGINVTHTTEAIKLFSNLFFKATA